MADSNRIFRQAALDRLSSPEQLDQLMQVTTPKSWVALGACCVLVLIAVAWSIWGTIRINVEGRGILIKHGGVFVATAFGDGRVTDILVSEGERVTNGQLLARLSVPDLWLKIQQAQVTQRNLTNEFKMLQAFTNEEAVAEETDRKEQTRTYGLMLSNYQAQLKASEGRLSAMTATGTIDAFPIAALLEVTNTYFSAQQGLAQTRIQLEQLLLNQLQATERRRQQMREKQLQLLQGAQALESLSALYQLDTEIRSPLSGTGTLLEITVKSNQLVNAHMPIMSLQPDPEKLEAWLFLPPGEGKRVGKGMEVHLALASAKKEDFGTMVGKVGSVSPLPATPQLMLRVLENPTLVTSFSQEGAPIYVVVNLVTDTNNATGYCWTSRKGPPMQITSGTLCEGTITLTNRSLITIVLPLIKNIAGL